MNTRAGVLLLPLLLCACPSGSPLPGPVAQLDRFKEAEKAGRLDDIATAAVNTDCTPPFQSQACPQILEVRGRACMQLARNALASGSSTPGLLTACPLPEQRAHLDCAASSFALARQSGAFTSTQADEMGEMQAQALYCQAAMSGPGERATLAADAAAILGQLGANARRDDLAANAALNLARNPQTPPEARCRWANQALGLATRGLSETPSPAVLGGLNSVHSGAVQAVSANACTGA